MLFHFANAPMLPLVGQKLAAAFPEEATAMVSACIVAAQLVMLPIALLVGRTADSSGRKPLFLAGFAILPIRAKRRRHQASPYCCPRSDQRWVLAILVLLPLILIEQ
jgi:MFS family permease